ncbi:MAG TPA: ATP-binding cassette domain-containing protein [Acidimicrobiales bacterium]|nr:ATP-binding cassette domain-containing protein [Acidimicrobiales bacterium]
MTKFLTLVVSGAVTGAIFSLVAAGLTLTYSATGIFNFAYGGVAFSAAYVYYELDTALGWPIVPSAIVTLLVFAPLLGLLLNAVVFRPLARASESAKIVATVGLLLALPALTQWVSDLLISIFHVHTARSSTVLQIGFPSGLGPVPAKVWHIGKIPFNSNEMVVFACALACALVLWVLMRRTPLGLRMRAVVDRAPLARIRGINEGETSRYAWVIGTMLAALAGVVGAPILGAISSNAFISVMFVASAAVVVGALRSIPIAFAAGALLGVAENLVTGYAKFASYITGFNDSVPVIILLAALIILARDRTRRAGSAAEEAPPPDYLADIPLWRRALPWVAAGVFLVIYIQWLSNNFWAGVMAQGLALSLVFMSFVIVTGMGGMVSLAQATFVTVAGLTTGLMFQHFHVPFYAAAGIGVLSAIVLGLIVALPALRLGGLPLALATLALALLGDNVLFQWNWYRNENTGWEIPRLKIGALNLANNRAMALTLLVLVLVVMWLINNLRRSPWGRSIAAVRSSEVAATTSGVSPLRVKLALFGLSAAVAGLGGIFYASYQGNVSNSTTPAIVGLLWLATVVLFGIRRPAAAAWAGIGAAMTPVIISSGFHWWSWVPTWLSWGGTNSPEIPAMLFGLGAITLARQPDGFLAGNAKQRYEKRAAKRAAAGRQAAPGAPPVPGAVVEAAALVADASAAPAALAPVDYAPPPEGLVPVAGEPPADGLIPPDGSGARDMLVPSAVPDVILPGVAAEEEAAIEDEVARHSRELISAGAVHGSGGGLSTEDALLHIRAVRAGYGDVEVLHGIDLPVRRGAITALFGANGSGKSTLCGTISGLVPVTSGALIFEGKDLGRVPAYRRVGRGVLVAPESRGIFPGLTVEENLMLRLGASDRDEVYSRFEVLRERRRLPAGSLSGGEQQMLTVAPLLSRPPRLVVVDEPTLGLAPLIIGQLLDLFRELRDRGTTILLIEEKVRDVLDVADYAAFIELGHIVWAGPRSDIDDRRLVQAYLGAQL